MDNKQLNPIRNQDAADREQSANRILEMAQAFLHHVCTSAQRCPLYAVPALPPTHTPSCSRRMQGPRACAHSG